MGLAYELGHKLVLEKGLFAVEAADLQQIRVSGKLKVLEGSVVRYVTSCRLVLRDADARLAQTLVQKQGTLLGALHFNVVLPDVRVPGGSLDLLGYFIGKNNYNLLGRA